MKKLWRLTFLLTILLAHAFACEPEPGAQHFPKVQAPPRIQSGYFAVYNKLNGLPCNDVRSILPFDNDNGNLTIVGTLDKGLMIFDGEKWHVSGSGLFEFPEITVAALTRAGADSFYAGTPHGILKGTFSGDRLTFSPVGIHREANLNVLAITADPTDEDKFLVGCDRIAGNLNSDVFTPFRLPEHLSPTGFSAIAHTKSGNFAGCNGGLYRIVSDMLQPFFSAEDPIGWINAFATAEKRLFIASANGVFVLNEDEKIENLLPGIWTSCLGFSAFPEDLLNGSSKKPFTVDGSAEMVQANAEYTALVEQNVQLQEEYAAYTRRYAGQAQADQSAVTEMYRKFFDFEAKMQDFMAKVGGIKAPLVKGLWVGTQDQGVILFATNGQRYHLTRDNSKLPADQITAIACRDNGETWIGTGNGGLMRYTTRHVGRKGSLVNLVQCKPTRIRVITDLLLIGTEKDGLHMYDIGEMKSLGHFDDSNTRGFHKLVTDFAIDRDGNLWITGDAGVLQWNGKTWKNIEFAAHTAKPSAAASRIEIDSANRIFIAFASASKVYNQIYLYNGDKLVGVDPVSVMRAIGLPAEAGKKAISQLGLSGEYLRSFDFKNASATLQAYEQGDDAKVTSLLNTEHYLLTGLDNGLQKIFDGENFKQLSEKGTGKIGPIRNLFRLPSGILAIQGEEGICEFDGRDYRLIESAATGFGFKITDMCLDQMNPETYRIGFSSSDGGGYARFQDSFWEKFHTEDPVISIAQSDLKIFMATPSGVYYLIE